jgi:hypothetical protein
LQGVICTAYSDHSWSEVSETIGQLDQLLILKKPFDSIEVVQLVHALTEKWRLLQERSWLVGAHSDVKQSACRLLSREEI